MIEMSHDDSSLCLIMKKELSESTNLIKCNPAFSSQIKISNKLRLISLSDIVNSREFSRSKGAQLIET